MHKIHQHIITHSVSESMSFEIRLYVLFCISEKRNACDIAKRNGAYQLKYAI